MKQLPQADTLQAERAQHACDHWLTRHYFIARSAACFFHDSDIDTTTSHCVVLNRSLCQLLYHTRTPLIARFTKSDLTNNSLKIQISQNPGRSCRRITAKTARPSERKTNPSATHSRDLAQYEATQHQSPGNPAAYIHHHLPNNLQTQHRLQQTGRTLK